MSVDEHKWYVRIRGKTLGPFSWPQLEAMRNRGQLSRFHELSQDRREWIGAGSLADLFAPEGGGRGAGPRGGDPGFAVGEPRGGPDAGISYVSTSTSSAESAEPVSWYYARGGTSLGPVTAHDLRALIARGEVDGASMVWREGMSGWCAVRDVPELAALLASPGSAQVSDQAPAGPPRTSGMAIASLVLGILWLFWVGSLLAVIFGGASLSQIARSRGTLEGKGMAISGLVLGIVGLSVLAALFFLGVIDGMARQAELQRLPRN